MEPKLRILLVEDDRDLAAITQAALEFEGFHVEVAHDGREGLDAVDRALPDVVITDLIMPVLDGLQLIERLQLRTDQLPIIAISAVGSRLHAARQLGAVEALVKPVEPQELAAAARKAVRRARA